MSDVQTPTPEDQKELAAGIAEMAEAVKGPSKLDAVKVFIWKYLGAAFADRKNGKLVVSLGRLAFVAWYAQAAFTWASLKQGEDIPSSMETVGLVLLGYVTATKALDVIKARKG